VQSAVEIAKRSDAGHGEDEGLDLVRAAPQFLDLVVQVHGQGHGRLGLGPFGAA